MSAIADACVLIIALAAFIFFTVGMWAPVTGGSMPIKEWFSWHPVLMSLAFPCLMVLGRWTYVADTTLWGSDKTTRRILHKAIMGTAAGVALIGYLCIFMSHLPKGQFLGYDFQEGAWKEWRRVAHVWSGYATLILVIGQSCMGVLKIRALDGGNRILTFHGMLGKFIIVLATVTLAAAISFWGWSPGFKIILYLLVCASAGFAVFWPKQEEVGKKEDEPLVSGKVASGSAL